MRQPVPTQEIFNELLANAIKGEMPWTDSGMGTDTFKALGRVARAYPNANPALIAAAKAAFARRMAQSRTNRT
jgi:hypothetical protein